MIYNNPVYHSGLHSVKVSYVSKALSTFEAFIAVYLIPSCSIIAAEKIFFFHILFLKVIFSHIDLLHLLDSYCSYLLVAIL